MQNLSFLSKKTYITQLCKAGTRLLKVNIVTINYVVYIYKYTLQLLKKKYNNSRFKIVMHYCTRLVTLCCVTEMCRYHCQFEIKL